MGQIQAGAYIDGHFFPPTAIKSRIGKGSSVGVRRVEKHQTKRKIPT